MELLDNLVKCSLAELVEEKALDCVPFLPPGTPHTLTGNIPLQCALTVQHTALGKSQLSPVGKM